ncbi:hypothetical protein E2C01_072392 [Portunus trituberculatus]|uniref:Uncharacterized protein n=1 Tax=Portunus trituberculatus TaxID=210409 RepID=A0A5B7I6K7_PORTR|nr:hypothetical protein [Portunus trituberculatus]
MVGARRLCLWRVWRDCRQRLVVVGKMAYHSHQRSDHLAGGEHYGLCLKPTSITLLWSPLSASAALTPFLKPDRAASQSTSESRTGILDPSRE